MFVRAVGVNLYTCSVPVDWLSLFVTIFPLKPRGFAAAEPVVSAITAAIATTATNRVVSRRISPLLG